MENRELIDKYTYRVEWSEEDNTHIAKCLEFPSLMAHGATSVKALNEMEVVVTETIEWMGEDGEDIPEPFGLKKYKGNLTLRVPPELHKNLAIKSAEEGISINKYILSRISAAV
ncbi:MULTISPECIES: type II toxin-antitoxin system HicB family antitoxin [unclassified Oceanispirochaeta]|uniref:type II toxin-antitoxin system HicB family antitoxin n=1 Tax=unclassified Oceanispirochaeta TaxID=2635722 RepID=UPI000E09767B|nr:MULTISPECIES: toxin-antitoxin system HicB family antitoxin [unclassified Oceanispirochaeta]MBF9015191.1 toxin-antitoxin system HicB family antitoxin [Oceanispirochaeta sp. M2]NPD71649.1 toxin-antitoxin system HicB family antitoxin [Oceanispirochaeta sp. M1]RDG33214.1 toxin-antitoxin system HicB family antitoxin [Oceanispirochaeta sp. M1]